LIEIRKTLVIIEETRSEGGKRVEPPVRKVGVLAVVNNPYVGRFSQDLDEIIEFSGGLGRQLGNLARETIAHPVEGYGKAAIVGTSGEQEHAVAFLTTVFGDAFREAVGGGKAWISSATKRGCAGSRIDIPIAFKDALWVRSHYDALEVGIPDAPNPDEVVVAVAVTNRERPQARLGGLRKEDVKGEDGLR
jgi:hypothetical protein